MTVLEQVAALRYIGSQTHPAVQQMVLEHENRLEQVSSNVREFRSGQTIAGNLLSPRMEQSLDVHTVMSHSLCTRVYPLQSSTPFLDPDIPPLFMCLEIPVSTSLPR